jgi:hypothetical protein
MPYLKTAGISIIKKQINLALKRKKDMLPCSAMYPNEAMDKKIVKYKKYDAALCIDI